MPLSPSSAPTPAEEPTGAVREAAVLLLAGQGGAEPDPDQIRSTASPAELFQGTGTLIAALVDVIAGDGDPLDLVAPVLRRLRRTEPGLTADLVATIGGALVASALGHSPTGWRTRGDLPSDGALPVPADEAYAWTITGRLLVDLLDHAAGKGTAASLLGEL